MRMTVTAYMRNTRALARVVDHIGHHLDDEIRIADLADIACLSSSAFERLYCVKVEEAPIMTVRRLRLQRAYERLQRSESNLLSVGLDAGYSSHAAFTRAFVRQFGMPPSRISSPLEVRQHETGLRFEWMPPTPVVAAPYRGERPGMGDVAREICARVALSGAKRWRFWRLLDLDNPLHDSGYVNTTCLVHVTDGAEATEGFDRLVLSGGPCAVATLRGPLPWPTLAQLDAQIAAAGPWRRDAQRQILYREIRVSAYTAPQDRHVEFWVPLVR